MSGRKRINQILDRIDELLKEVSNLSAQNAEEIEQLRLKYLSKKGEINEESNRCFCCAGASFLYVCM